MQKKSGNMKSGLDAMSLFLLDDLLKTKILKKDFIGWKKLSGQGSSFFCLAPTPALPTSSVIGNRVASFMEARIQEFIREG